MLYTYGAEVYADNTYQFSMSENLNDSNPQSELFTNATRKNWMVMMVAVALMLFIAAGFVFTFLYERHVAAVNEAASSSTSSVSSSNSSTLTSTELTTLDSTSSSTSSDTSSSSETTTSDASLINY